MGGEEGLVLVGDAKQKKHSSTTLSELSNNLLCLSDQLKFWTSKYTVRDGNQLIDVSSAACDSSSTIPIGATQQNFLCTGTVYQFDPTIFHNTNNEFDLDDVEVKLVVPMEITFMDTEDEY
jgi:hypothetical protein